MNPFKKQKKTGWDRVREDVGHAMQNGGVKAALMTVGGLILATVASGAASAARNGEAS